MASTNKELEGHQQSEKALAQKHKDAEKRYKKLLKAKENVRQFCAVLSDPDLLT